MSNLTGLPAESFELRVRGVEGKSGYASETLLCGDTGYDRKKLKWFAEISVFPHTFRQYGDNTMEAILSVIRNWYHPSEYHNYNIKDLIKTGICPKCGGEKWEENDGLTYCSNCKFWVEGTLSGQTLEKEHTMSKEESVEERSFNDNEFNIKTKVNGGESNYPGADKFETIRTIVDAIDREDILSITITKSEKITK